MVRVAARLAPDRAATIVEYMTISYLPNSDSTVEPPEFAGPDHPIRKVTRAAALDNEWTKESATFMRELFDDMAPTWNEGRDNNFKRLPLQDALDRGEVGEPAVILELGSGTGLGTKVLAERFPGRISAMDIALGMLTEAEPNWGARTQADASTLPVLDNAVDMVVLVNALLFPSEIERVLRPNGAVVWVNSLGVNTPIHLSAEDVVLALPGEWGGVASRAGTGTWAVVRRSA